MLLWAVDRNNILSEMVKQYWERLVYLFSVDVAFVDMKTHPNQEKRSHKRFIFISKVVNENDENRINELIQCIHRLFNYDFTRLTWSIARSFTMLNTMTENKNFN